MASAGANGMAMAPGMRQADMNAHAFASAVDASEVQQGVLAQQRAASPAVRTFASLMATEHSNALRGREARMSQLGMGLGIGSSSWTASSAGAIGAGSGSSGAMNTSSAGSGSGSSGAMNTSNAGSGSAGMNMGSGSMGSGSAGGAMMLTSDGMATLNGALLANSASRPVAQAAPAALQQLQGLSGAAFDRAYIDQQVAAHQYALQNMDRMIASGTLSPEVLGVVQAMRASVAGHLQTAMQLRAGL